VILTIRWRGGFASIDSIRFDSHTYIRTDIGSFTVDLEFGTDNDFLGRSSRAIASS